MKLNESEPARAAGDAARTDANRSKKKDAFFILPPEAVL
jgi:hypothetical protein